MIDFRVIKKNRYGHRWIKEPEEREKFRGKCKHQELGCICKKHYYSMEMHGKELVHVGGCSPNVYCPRLRRWDTMHGLREPNYTFVERE